MPTLTVENLTDSDIVVQAPAGGFSLKVTANDTVTNKVVDDDDFQAIESQLEAMATASKITWSIDDDAGSVGDDPMVPVVTNGELGQEVVYVVNVPDAATGDVNTAVDEKFEVLDVVVQKRGGAGGAANLVQVKSTGTAITDDMSINVADKVLVRAGTIDDTSSTIAAGGVLRVTRTKVGGNAACLVTVRGVKRA